MRRKNTLLARTRRGINRAKVYQLLKENKFLSWNDLMQMAKLPSWILSNVIEDLYPKTIGIIRESEERFYYLKQPDRNNVIRSKYFTKEKVNV